MRLDADWLSTPATRAVTGVLAQGGHRAWFVGGCVRNALLGAPVADLDLSTDAPPDRVTELAEAAGLRVIPTGIEHGTVTVIAEGQPFEVTTLRRDVETDGRHAIVSFAATLEDDAGRRDFTMNALYAAPDGTVSDPTGQGLDDLAARRIRFIGDAAARIGEDRLRILRFFRFHAWYGDPDEGIDADGLAACAEGADGIDDLARERVGAEMLKLLGAPDPAPATASMAASGALLRVLPGAAAEALAPLVHLEGEAGLAPDPVRRLAALGGEDPVGRLRLSRAEATRLGRLRDAVGGVAGPGELGYRLGADEAVEVLVLRAALAAMPWNAAVAETAAAGACAVMPVAAVDLTETGPALGARLREIEARWIESGFQLKREQLLD